MIPSLARCVDVMLYLVIFLFLVAKGLLYGIPVRVFHGFRGPVNRSAPLALVSYYMDPIDIDWLTE